MTARSEIERPGVQPSSADGAMDVQLAMLVALNMSGKHIYGGTVPYKERQRRRKAGRRAKQSRKANRA